MEIKPKIETFANIKVVGVGGSGSSAVNRMIDRGVVGVEFIVVNTDAQALSASQAPVKIHIGRTSTRGLGAGMDPDLGFRAAEENQDEIREALKGADMVFIASGMGGGTGTGASRVVASLAREMGSLVVGVITKPFAFEGKQRSKIAEEGLEKLIGHLDTVITISNDKLLQIIDRRTSLIDSFMIVDDVLRHGVQAISELITRPGLVNVDFADVKSVMKGAGSALMGVGTASGDNRATEATRMAIESPLLDLNINGARGVLFTVMGGNDLSMHEVSEAMSLITDSVDPEAKIIFGAVIDENMKDEIKITVIATGFDNRYPSAASFMEKRTVRMQDAPEDMTIERLVKKTLTQNRVQTPSPEPKINTAPMQQAEIPLEREVKKYASNYSSENQAQSQPSVSVKPNTLEDELEIPAFIRKKMK